MTVDCKDSRGNLLNMPTLKLDWSKVQRMMRRGVRVETQELATALWFLSNCVSDGNPFLKASK